MDSIFIEDLQLSAQVGIYSWEKAGPQVIELQLEAGIPKEAMLKDDIAATIDYAEVVARLEQEFAARRFNLVETLAEFVANLLIEEFGAPWVKLSVAKIGMFRNVRRVGVRIERHRG